MVSATLITGGHVIGMHESCRSFDRSKVDHLDTNEVRGAHRVGDGYGGDRIDSPVIAQFIRRTVLANGFDPGLVEGAGGCGVEPFEDRCEVDVEPMGGLRCRCEVHCVEGLDDDGGGYQVWSPFQEVDSDRHRSSRRRFMAQRLGESRAIGNLSGDRFV